MSGSDPELNSSEERDTAGSVRSRAVLAREAIAVYRDALSPGERAEYDMAFERGRRTMRAVIDGREPEGQPSPARGNDPGTS